MTIRSRAMRAWTGILLIAGVLTASQAFAQPQDEVSYFLTDAVGSIRLVTDATGQVVEDLDYVPFGQQWPDQSANERRGFGGKEFDRESRLDYFGARYLHSATGRFTSVDPLSAPERNITDPQSWNSYVYVRNNPLRYVDPDGRFWREIGSFFKAVGGGVASAASMTWGLLFSPLFTATLVDGPDSQPQPTPLLSPETAAAVGPSLAAGTVNATITAFKVVAGTGVVSRGTILYRVFGNEAQGLGQSWTTVKPTSGFREAAGLFPGNTGRFVIRGELISTEGVVVRQALPGPGGVGGGIIEVLVPNPATQIRITGVSGVNPAF